MDAVQGVLQQGSRVGRYMVESFLGAGGMGEVYVARDTLLGRQIALKVLPSGCAADRIERFVREAQTSSASNHPSIVSIYDSGVADGMQFLAMELIDGEPLSSWMESHTDVAAGIELMAQVADGLARAHDAGIVHRDLKPPNIMVGRDGRAKLVDFGAAKLTERMPHAGDDDAEVVTARISAVGTPAYMSPEQVDRRPVDHRSDVFSFGTVLYELLARRHPFAVSSFVDTIHNVVHHAPALNAIPRRWRRIVARCLAKDPDERYQSMREIANDLRDFSVEPSPSGVLGGKVRTWLPAIVMAALLFVQLAIIVVARGATAARPLSLTHATTSATAMARGGSAFISTQCASAAAPKPTNHA